MAREIAGSPGATLSTRILSALVLTPPVVAAIYVGWPFFELLMILAAVLLAAEWDRLCGGKFGVSGVGLAALCVSAVALAAIGRYGWAAGVIAMGVPAVYLAARLAKRRHPALSALGSIYFGLPLLTMVWLRSVPDGGAWIVIWLVAVVAATDVGAYFAGRGFGGPKLAPTISPNKTWSGLVGGMLAAGSIGGGVAWLIGCGEPGWAFAAGLGLAVVAQAGDLAESAAKRFFGVKDSGALIPGHGGLLDRVDGLVAAAPALAALIWWSGGQGAAWR
jgi:phosphatidate cytidylyltransferase